VVAVVPSAGLLARCVRAVVFLGHGLEVGGVVSARPERAEPIDVVDLRGPWPQELGEGFAFVALAVRMVTQVSRGGAFPP
jgi:hypothetical protein